MYQQGDGYSTGEPLPEHLARIPSSRREPSHVSSQGEEAASVTHDIYETVKFNKDKATKVYEINIEKKKILKERREKALQNAKDRDAEKANAQAALQAHTRASKASKDNQDIKMTEDAATSEDSTQDIHLPPHPHGKAKYLSQIKTSSKYRTVHTEPLLGDPLPGSQAITKVHGHKPDSGDIGIYEFLIKGAPNHLT